MQRPTVVVSQLGTQLDSAGKTAGRWEKWRPNVSLCSQPDFLVNELHLLHDNHSLALAELVKADIHTVSPDTVVQLHAMNYRNPWDFEEVYAKLFDWCREQAFDADRADHLFHITTGTHVAQICSFLLTESRHFPGRLLQSRPHPDKHDKARGQIQVIDLHLSRYDQLANRFDTERQQGHALLKGGIDTKNTAFNQLISQLETVAIRAIEPILLTGPTGAGKSALAKRLFMLKKHRQALRGDLVSVNCATLRGDNAMAALFGHTKGAFTGAVQARQGFLKSADHGVLFLDEIGELGLEEQAMLLHAIEYKTFYPVGSDKSVHSEFQLICGTNRDLAAMVAQGTFRDDLLARIQLWSFDLPALKDRREDIPANIEFELAQIASKTGKRVQFNQEAYLRFLAFAQAPSSSWPGNFRDLSAAINRMSTLANGARIALADVEAEISRLQRSWGLAAGSGYGLTDTAPQHWLQHARSQLAGLLQEAQLAELDGPELVELAYVVSVARQCRSMAEAGRQLYAASRLQKSSHNDSARLQKYLARFGLSWQQLQ